MNLFFVARAPTRMCLKFMRVNRRRPTPPPHTHTHTHTHTGIAKHVPKCLARRLIFMCISMKTLPGPTAGRCARPFPIKARLVGLVGLFGWFVCLFVLFVCFVCLFCLFVCFVCLFFVFCFLFFVFLRLRLQLYLIHDTGTVTAMDYSAAQKSFISASHDHTVHVFDPAMPDRLLSLPCATCVHVFRMRVNRTEVIARRFRWS